MVGIIGTIASLLIGGAVATAAVVGVVSSQNAAPSQSPVSVNAPAIQYGSNG